tara:strand:- start:490 stop:1662 length:1173 start_codon:yes stop_codon:yes gene_type:complete
MALVLNDRVKETTTTTGTGTINLGGAQTNFETFVAGIGNSNTTYYAIVHRSNAEFEIGLGTITDASPDTLARTTIISSSNSDSAVDFSAGTKDVFCTMPASKAVHEDGSSNVTLPADLSVGDDLTVLGGVIEFKSNSGSPASLKMYCESSNAHFQTLQPQPHSASAANTLRLPDSGDSGTQDLVAVDITQTLTNKTLTTPTINGATIGSSNLATSSNGDINFAPNGTGKIVVRGNTNQGKIVLNCESNSHGQTIIAAPHSESANNVLTLPSTGGDARLLSATSTATVTNKSIDSDNNTITNIVNADIKSSAAIADSKLATISTAGKVALTALEIDGGSDIGADLTTSDLIIVDDGAGGTNKKAALSRVVTLMQAQGFSTEDPTALAIALG